MYVSTQPRAALGAYQAIVLTRRRTTLRRRPQTLGTLGSAAGQIGKQAGTAAATVAVAAIPVVGPFLAPLVGMISGIFSKHHAAAMANEAEVMNAAFPNYYVTLQQIVQAANSGQSSPSAAKSQVDQAVADYYSMVQSIMKKSGPCRPPNKRPGDPCNAACAVACEHVEPDANATKAALDTGGTVQISGFNANGQIQGLPSMTLDVSPPGAGSSLSGSVGGAPMWVWIAGGGVVVLLLVMSMGK
jgi:hypothetical protein